MNAVTKDLLQQTEALSEDLAAVGSTVYIWANQDIVTSMNDVKSDLAKPTTGEPTQSEQARIVEQLDAMIKNLAVKPKESKFAAEGGGGGGGGGNGGPQLPTEAELRLLKSLQEAVNKSTKRIDEQPGEKDEGSHAGTSSMCARGSDGSGVSPTLRPVPFRFRAARRSPG